MAATAKLSKKDTKAMEEAKKAEEAGESPYLFSLPLKAI